MLYAFEKTKKQNKKKKVERITNNVVLSSFVFLLIKFALAYKIALAFSFIRYHDGFSLPFFHEAIFCFSSDI